ncbi:MAG TPA: tripartite tricarboxylate transporter substrate-binding protein [Pseudolabrys sp.]|nr:tripartite tricarboxylate transporter substrate-binding protein [Pseudolabrys sp.]
MTLPSNRRGFVARAAALTVAAAALSLSAPAPAAEQWPAHPITFVVPYPPGGPVDFIARLMGERLSASLGLPVIVENRGGAGGAIGTARAIRSAPDGYTYAVILDAHTVNPYVLSSMPFDADKDVQAVTRLVQAPMLVATGAGKPYRNFKDVIEASKKKPGGVSYGVSPSTLGSFMLSQLQALGGFKMLLVAYPGAAPAMTDALGGQIDLVVGLPNLIVPQVKSGRLRALGVSTTERWPKLPEVPTFAEQGFPGFSASGWVGLIAPVGTPAAIVDKMNGAVRAALKDERVLQKLELQGMEPAPMAPDEFQAFIRSELKRWGEVAKRNKLAGN